MRSGIQSVLDPAGPQSARIAGLWWVFLGVCSIVYILTIAMFLLAVWRAHRHSEPELGAARHRRMSITVAVASGITILTLLGLLIADAATGHAIAMFGEQDSDQIEIQVMGHQWWWEVTYPDPESSRSFKTANEIHIPVGRVALLRISTGDVIHSLWIPNLHGKLDLIPGRFNKMRIRADRAGVFRAQCAEYCGMQHAHMALVVFADEPKQYEAWKATQQSPASEPMTADQQKGREIFLSLPCVNCHSIVGTDAYASLGPDLTHIASRRTLAAGTLMNNRGSLAGWIVNAPAVKPGTLMPPNVMDSNELIPLLAYLESLR